MRPSHSIPYLVRSPLRVRAFVVTALAAVLAGAHACAPDPAKTMSNPSIAGRSDSTPMALDPTAPIEVHGWWSNGRQLLHLEENGAYRIWAGSNRFDVPLQNGRWTRLTYAAIELQPYGRPVDERTRCDFEMAGSEVQLQIPLEGVAPMVRFTEAPSAIEDRLVGTWNGPGGTLRLADDGRYRAEAPPSGSAQPISLAGHGGRWLVEAANLLLIPDSPSVPPVFLAVEPLGSSDVRLRAGDGLYLRTRTQ